METQNQKKKKKKKKTVASHKKDMDHLPVPLILRGKLAVTFREGTYRHLPKVFFSKETLIFQLPKKSGTKLPGKPILGNETRPLGNQIYKELGSTDRRWITTRQPAKMSGQQ